jgi:histidinol-phosphate aminotransferase
MAMGMPEHGGLDEQEVQELGLDPAEVLDLSANIAPISPPRGVMEALRRCSPAAYPDRHYRRLRHALGRMLEVDAACILPGNGSTELIHLICLAFLDPESHVVILGPTFSEYERAARLAGSEVTALAAREENDFVWRMREVVDVVRALRPRLLFLCNPNNPTGLYLSAEDVETLLGGLDDGLLVLDEAYLDFVENPWNSLHWLDHGHVMGLRSLTKALSLPGLRLGYVVGRPDLLEGMKRHQPTWSVNAFAEAAGIAAAESCWHLDHVRRAVAEAKSRLARGLSALGLRVVVGAANFLMVDVGDAKRARLALLRQGICVRDCSSFGLPSYIRMSVPAPTDVDRALGTAGQVASAGVEA